MQAPGTARDVSSLASYALGLACGTSSSFRLGLPVSQLMRGHIVGPTVRCLSGYWAQPSGLLRHAGGSVSYYMMVILLWFAHWEGSGHLSSCDCRGPRCAVQNRPHRRGIKTPGRYPCLFPAAFLVLAGRSGSGDLRGFAILALQPAWARFDHTPMRPGAGEYQVLGQLTSG